MDKKNLIIIIVLILIACWFIFFNKPQNNATQKPANQNNSQVQGNKLCDWVDQSDIIIKVKFANESIKKDTSYETGFLFGSNYFNARLARSGCDYRTGFKYAELKNKGVAQIGIKGYTDNKMRTIQGAPINVIFDKDGKPDIGTYIEVTIVD